MTRRLLNLHLSTSSFAVLLKVKSLFYSLLIQTHFKFTREKKNTQREKCVICEVFSCDISSIERLAGYFDDGFQFYELLCGTFTYIKFFSHKSMLKMTQIITFAVTFSKEWFTLYILYNGPYRRHNKKTKIFLENSY